MILKIIVGTIAGGITGGVIGYYGFNNLGDELNLQCMMENIKNEYANPEFIIFSDCRQVEGKVDYCRVGIDDNKIDSDAVMQHRKMFIEWSRKVIGKGKFQVNIWRMLEV